MHERVGLKRCVARTSRRRRSQATTEPHVAFKNMAPVFDIGRGESVKRIASPTRLNVSYVLPISSQTTQAEALSDYVGRLAEIVGDLIIVDGSSNRVFNDHARAWPANVRHVRPNSKGLNGKVAGVMTGAQAARYDRVIVADDDVRYNRESIIRILTLLETYEIVRPQNFFGSFPWHARWDTARSLLNRISGGDWPGTLGIRRSVLLDAGGYSGDVLFENLEMVRTIRAAGGRESVPLDLFVLRLPPSARHFRSQRVRQAYDEWARPFRLAAQMALLPLAIFLWSRSPVALLAALATSIVLAEIGRRIGNGSSVFPRTSALWAPAWLAERAITSWLAFGTRVFFGGVRYRDNRIKCAATAARTLKSNLLVRASMAKSGR